MKGQGKYRSSIMCIQPGTLTFAGTESKKILENFLMGNYTADDCHQHEQGRNADNPACPDSWQTIQFKVETV